MPVYLASHMQIAQAIEILLTLSLHWFPLTSFINKPLMISCKAIGGMPQVNLVNICWNIPVKCAAKIRLPLPVSPFFYFFFSAVWLFRHRVSPVDMPRPHTQTHIKMLSASVWEICKAMTKGSWIEGAEGRGRGGQLRAWLGLPCLALALAWQIPNRA